MKVALHWLARTGIFVAAVLALYLIGWFDVIAIFAAFVVAWLISYLALPGMRRAAQLQMDQVLDRSRKNIRAAHAEEDAELDGVALNKEDSATDKPAEDR